MTSAPRLVAPEKRQAADGLLQAGDTFRQLAGPSLGGIVYAWRGIGAAAVLDAAGFLLAVSAIAATRLAVGDPPPATARSSLWADLRWTVLFLRRSALLSWADALWGMEIFVLGPLRVLLAVLVEQALRLPPVAFGYLLSVQGAGMLPGTAMTASALRRIPRRGR